MLFSFRLMGKEEVGIWTPGKRLPDFWNCGGRFSEAEPGTESVPS